MEIPNEESRRGEINELYKSKRNDLIGQILYPFMSLSKSNGNMSVNEMIKWISLTNLLHCYANIRKLKEMEEKMEKFNNSPMSYESYEDIRSYFGKFEKIGSLSEIGSIFYLSSKRLNKSDLDGAMLSEIINEFDSHDVALMFANTAFSRLMLAISIVERYKLDGSNQETYQSPAFEIIYAAADKIQKSGYSVNYDESLFMERAKCIEDNLATMVKGHTNLLTDPVAYESEISSAENIANLKSGSFTGKTSPVTSRSMHEESAKIDLSKPSLFKFVLLAGYYREFGRLDKILNKYSMYRKNQLTHQDTEKLNAYIKSQIDYFEDFYDSAAGFKQLSEDKLKEIIKEAVRNIYQELKKLKLYDTGDVAMDDDIMSIFDIYVDAKLCKKLQDVADRCVVDGFTGKRRA